MNVGPAIVRCGRRARRSLDQRIILSNLRWRKCRPERLREHTAPYRQIIPSDLRWRRCRLECLREKTKGASNTSPRRALVISNRGSRCERAGRYHLHWRKCRPVGSSRNSEQQTHLRNLAEPWRERRTAPTQSRGVGPSSGRDCKTRQQRAEPSEAAGLQVSWKGEWLAQRALHFVSKSTAASLRSAALAAASTATCWRVAHRHPARRIARHRHRK